MALKDTITEIINNCTKQIIDLDSFCTVMNTDTANYFHEYFPKYSQDDDYEFENNTIKYTSVTDNWDKWGIFKYTPPYTVILALDGYFRRFGGGQDTYLHDNGITVSKDYADAVLQSLNYKLASFNVEAPDYFEFGDVEVASGGALVYTAGGAFQTDDWSRGYGVNTSPVQYIGYTPTTRVELYNDSYNPISFDILFNCRDEYGNIFQHRVTGSLDADEAMDVNTTTRISGIFGIDASSEVYYASTGDILRVRVKELVL